ncbi:MAG: bifunctional [glutamine synthetase] adenylyltransferase/[glutamine synthetase]-adenylyl-L-tyrosine phosphorylase [Rubricella sp.]
MLLDGASRAPRAFHPERGEEAAALVPGANAAARAILAGAAGSSGHVDRLIRREAAFLSEALALSPEDAVQAAMTLPEGQTAETLGPALRRAKRRVALILSLVDLAGVRDVMWITRRLTDFADLAVDSALKALVSRQIDRGALPGQGDADKATAAGMTVLAMGKMGAGELNYSSDIDLIVLFDDSRYADIDLGEARAVFIKVTKQLTRLLSDVTEDGYVFRTDLRLRPDPSVTPVCISMDAAERYYESVGRTWERAAFIKARACAGDIAAGEAFLDRLAPFVWRRHLDFAAIEDAYGMIRAIRDHKGLTGPITVPGHDVKLGRGGIREIEFFTQTLQLIMGGRDPSLRPRGTLDALDALVAAGRVDPGEATILKTEYRALRDIEHRVQMMEDAQTHRLPASEEGLDRIAALAGFPDRIAFREDVRARLERVHALVEASLGDRAGREPLDAAARAFLEDGAVQEIIAYWDRLPATRSDRASSLFRRLKPEIVSRLAAAAEPAEALNQFDRFLRGLPAGVQVFSLFEANPALLDLLVEICAAAPRLAAYLGRHAAVFDAVLDRDFFAPLEGRGTLAAALQARLAPLDDFERVLDEARRWNKEVQFRAGVHLLRDLATHAEVAAAFSDIAEVSLDALMPRVIAEHARRHGPPPGRGAAVIAMGKLGSREMTATSDLDLIVVYDGAGEAESDGEKPLPTAQYYARLTRALTSAMTVQTAEGPLYEVDMRLRPSGRQGPVAVSLSGFRSYQRNEAWTWEHLALSRARVVAGPPDLAADVAGVIADVLALDRDEAQVLGDVRDMRARLAKAHQREASDPWELKQGPGRLLDIDLCIQAGLLLSRVDGPDPDESPLARLARAGWLSPGGVEALGVARDLMLHVQAVTRVAVDGRFAPERAGAGLRAVLLRDTGCASLDALTERLRCVQADAAAAIGDRLGT